MSNVICTSECEECTHSVINEENKSRIKVYCEIKDKSYYFGQYIPCEDKEKRTDK